MRLIYIVIVFVSFGGKSFSSGTNHKITEGNCKSLDIRETNPKLRKHFSSPRDQESMGWCYAFTAADLLSAELGVPVSSTHVSSIYNEKLATSTLFRYKVGGFGDLRVSSLGENKVFETGYSDLALKEVSDFGKVCLENSIPYNSYGSEGIGKIVKELETLKESLDKKSNTPQGEICSHIIKFLEKNPLQKTSASDLYKLLLKYNLNTALNKVITRHCSENLIDIGKVKVKWVKKKKKKKFFNTVVKQLQKGKPVAFSYDVKHVTGFNGYHSSLVTGIKWADNKCQLKIRNSWGEGCEGYEKEKIESCIKKEGSFWVSSEKFHEMAESITFITN